MMKIMLSLTFLHLTSSIFAQTKGVRFEQELNWEQIKAKAHHEKKFIFVDVFATWCGPCKAMDENIYPSEKLGAFMNESFISIKVQADTSKKDNQQIKSWYKDAKQIINDHKVNGYPTFMFFSPDGKLVDRTVGYNSIDDLTAIANEALNPKRQYYTLLRNYQKGIKEYKTLPLLIRKAKLLNEDSLAEILSADYLHSYLDKLSEEELFTKEHLLFATADLGDLFTTESRIFQLIYRNPQKVDSIVGNNRFAKSVISWRITKEEIYNKLWLNDNKAIVMQPDWSKIWTSIKNKYSANYADSLITPAQFLFYMIEKNWIEYAKLTESVIKIYPPRRGGNKLSTAIGGVALKGPGNDAWGLNAVAWTLFENTTDSSLLEKALLWSDLSIKLVNPKSVDAHQNYDTKANLLYKLGRISNALECEQKAIDVLNSNDQQAFYKHLYTEKYRVVISKMKEGKKTW